MSDFLTRLQRAWGMLRADSSGLGTYGPADDYWYTNYVRQTAAGIRVSPDTALSISAVFACVRVVSETIASLPLIIYRRLPDGGKERATDHPLYKLLHDRPNQWQTAFEFWEMMQGHLELRGNAFAAIESGNGRAIDALVPIHPDRVHVYRIDNGRLRYEVLPYYTGITEHYAQEELFHLRGMSSNGLVGMSTVYANAETFGTAKAQQDYVGRFFDNDATPGGVFLHPKTLTAESHDRLKKSINESQSGANRHKTMVLEEGMSYTKVGLTNRESQMIEARQFSRSDIASAFRVPLHKIGDLTRATFCLPGDAQVSTEFGPKPICDVAVGERVWSMNAEGALVLNKVLRSECTGEDPILTIRTVNRTIRCNAKHKLLVRREVAEEYKGGQGRYRTRKDGWKYRRVMANEYVPAGDLKVGDKLVAVNAIPEQNGTKAPTREATVPFMEVLGMLLGDGFFARTSKTGKGSSFGISHAENASFMPYYVQQIEQLFQRRTLNRATGTRELHAVQRDKNTTMFYSTAAYEELAACGIVGTAKTKHIPEWIFGLTNELKAAFLRGYLDADGTIEKAGNHIRLVSVNRGMLDQVRHLCISAGIHVSNLFSSEISSDFGGYGEYTHVLWGFVCTNIDDIALIGTHTKMYQDRIDARLANRRTRVVREYPYERQFHTDFAASFHSTPIKSVELSDNEAVYNLEVNTNHNFVADGVIVSNSNIEQQAIEFATDSIRPRAVRIERRVNNDLVDPLDIGDGFEYFAEFLMDALLRGDQKSRYESYAIGIQNTFLSPNECRAFENLNPYEGGDKYYVPLNTIEAGSKQLSTPEQLAPREDSTATGAKQLPEPVQATALQRAQFLLKESVEASAERVVRKEVKALRRIVEKADSNPVKARTELATFYESHVDFVMEAMHIRPAAAEEYVNDSRRALAADMSEVGVSRLEVEAAGRLTNIVLREKQCQMDGSMPIVTVNHTTQFNPVINIPKPDPPAPAPHVNVRRTVKRDGSSYVIDETPIESLSTNKEK